MIEILKKRNKKKIIDDKEKPERNLYKRESL